MKGISVFTLVDIFMVLFLYYIHFCIRLHLPLITCHFLATVHAWENGKVVRKSPFFGCFVLTLKSKNLNCIYISGFFFDATLPFSRAKHCRKAVKTSINIIKFVYATSTFSPFPGTACEKFCFCLCKQLCPSGIFWRKTLFFSCWILLKWQ